MAAIDVNLEKKLQKSYFDVLGLCCSSEIPLVEKILRSMDGVKDFSIIIPTKTVIVVHDSVIITQVQIVKALNQARLEANIRVQGEKNYKNRWPSPYAILSGVLLVTSFLKCFYSPLKWLALGAVAVGIPPILLKAVTAIFINLRPFDINTLVLIAVAGSIALKDYWEAGTIVFLFTIAEWLETRASHKATAAMSSLVNLVPQKAIIADTGEEVNADEVKLNTFLAVKAGETIPIDGVVVEGNCEVDEKILTGESFPVSKEKDSSVWASTINLNGYITIKTTAVAEDCVVARMAKLVEEAQNRKSKIQRFIDQCAKYYTPSILVISGSIALVPLVVHVHDKKNWFRLALVVLVSGCPCALLLSTPVAMFCALSRAAMMGVLFKGAEYLETLAQIKIVAFDKTGTITRGEFIVVDVKSIQDDFDLEKMLYWISSIESKSSHPMAAALVDFARAKGVEAKPDQVDKFQNFPGEGICGFIDENEIYIGNSKIASRTGSTVPSLEGYEVEGKSVGYVFIGSSPACVFFLSDVCRTGAKEAIQELKSIGIKSVMLTGDCDAAAKHSQWQLNNALEAIYSELMPEDKARIIKQLEKEGPTAMVGDGINDALALTTAKIGISMGVSGSALATESGDIILMSNDIQRIPKAVKLARRVKRKIIENVVISILTKAGILGLAIAGYPLVWAAVLSDVGTCLLVICNSMLLLRRTPTKREKCCRSKAKSGYSIHKDSNHSSCSDIESQKNCAPRSCSTQKCASKCSSTSSTSVLHGVNGCSSTNKDHEHKAHHHSHEHEAHHHSHEHKAHHHSQDHNHVGDGSGCEKKSCSNLNTKHEEKHTSEHARQNTCCNGSPMKSIVADRKNKSHGHCSESHKMNDQKERKLGHSHDKCCQH